jgi:single-strand DNA-binding protein
MNTVTISGNLAADPELRFTPNGRAVINLSIGNNELVGDESKFNGFFDISLFGEQAARLQEVLKKGDRVLVTGRLQQNTWDAEDGSKRRKVMIYAQTVAPTLEFGSVSIDRAAKANTEEE